MYLMLRNFLILSVLYYDCFLNVTITEDYSTKIETYYLQLNFSEDKFLCLALISITMFVLSVCILLELYLFIVINIKKFTL